MRNAAIIGMAIFAGMATDADAREHEAVLRGESFLSACSNPEPDWIGFCHGYVQAVHDGVVRPGEDFCPPAGTTRADMVGIIVRQLMEAPNLKHVNAASVVYATLLKAYPCP
jgi:hypothetical protein